MIGNCALFLLSHYVISRISIWNPDDDMVCFQYGDDTHSPIGEFFGGTFRNDYRSAFFQVL